MQSVWLLHTAPCVMDGVLCTKKYTSHLSSVWKEKWTALLRTWASECFSPTLSSSSDMFDKTRSGRIDMFGFSALWDFMQRWRALFQQYDRDHSGSISAMELQQGISRARLASFFFSCAEKQLACWQFQIPLVPLCLLPSALAQMGYNLSPQFSQTLVQRFSVRGGRPGMQLDRFIQVCTQLQSTTQFFRERDTAMTGNIRISYEDFLSGAVTRLMWASLQGQSCFISCANIWQFYTVYSSSGVSRKVIMLQCGLKVKVHCLF